MNTGSGDRWWRPARVKGRVRERRERKAWFKLDMVRWDRVYFLLIFTLTVCILSCTIQVQQNHQTHHQVHWWATNIFHPSLSLSLSFWVYTRAREQHFIKQTEVLTCAGLTMARNPPFSRSLKPSLMSARLVILPPWVPFRVLLYCSMLFDTSCWLSWICDSLLRACRRHRRTNTLQWQLHVWKVKTCWSGIIEMGVAAQQGEVSIDSTWSSTRFLPKHLGKGVRRWNATGAHTSPKP